jgi:WD40 repeat protein
VWEAETGQEVLTLKGHTEMVWSVAFSPDGQRIATGIAGAAATAKVWHGEKRQEALVLQGHTAMVTSVAFSPDGNRIFAWDIQENVLAWSAADGKPIEPVNPPPAPPLGPARSPDGFRRAVPQGNLIVVTDERPPPKDNVWLLPDTLPMQ